MEQAVYTIDGHACRDFRRTIAEFNRVFERWWGEGFWSGNIDVFNDIIDWVEEGEAYTLVWAHSEVARRQIGHQAMIDWLEHKLNQSAGHWRWQQDLALAREGQGRTLFDWLVAIIREHAQIDLRLE